MPRLSFDSPPALFSRYLLKCLQERFVHHFRDELRHARKRAISVWSRASKGRAQRVCNCRAIIIGASTLTSGEPPLSGENRAIAIVEPKSALLDAFVGEEFELRVKANGHLVAAEDRRPTRSTPSAKAPSPIAWNTSSDRRSRAGSSLPLSERNGRPRCSTPGWGNAARLRPSSMGLGERGKTQRHQDALG